MALADAGGRRSVNAGVRRHLLLACAALLLVLVALAVTIAPSDALGGGAVAFAHHRHHPTPTASTTVRPTATHAATATATVVASATATATLPPTATLAPTATPTATVTATSLPTTTPTSTPTPAPSGWTTVLDDEFTGAGIPSHWELYDGHYGSGPANNCAAPSQDSAPGDGYLYLTMSYKASGTCGAGWYEGGMMISDPFQETNQAITVRWRILPSADPTIVRSHEIIPMIFPQTASYADAEDDLCETGQLTGCQSYLHYGGGSQVEHDYTIDLTQWHTMRFTQQNGVITATIDGVLLWSQNVGSSVLPNDVRRAVLQQECPAAACPTASYAGETERLQIDWITIQVPSA